MTLTVVLMIMMMTDLILIVIIDVLRVDNSWKCAQYIQFQFLYGNFLLIKS